MSALTNYIKDKLEIRQVPQEVLEKTNTLIEEAIWELQRSEILPAKSIQFKSIEKKERKIDQNGELQYDYYLLPEDFHRLDEFFVKDSIGDPAKRVPYLHTDYENYIDLLKTNDRRKFFSVKDITIADVERKVIIANPFPKDNTVVVIKYYGDGVDVDFNSIEKRYWKQILKEIEAELGIRDEQSVVDSRNTEISRTKNQQGQNKVNGTMRSVKPRFFLGRTGRGRGFNSNKYN